jgi:hypothetical protein
VGSTTRLPIRTCGISLRLTIERTVRSEQPSSLAASGTDSARRSLTSALRYESRQRSPCTGKRLVSVLHLNEREGRRLERSRPLVPYMRTMPGRNGPAGTKEFFFGTFAEFSDRLGERGAWYAAT